MPGGRPKGYPKTGGIKKGGSQKTRSVRETFEKVFNMLQETEGEKSARKRHDLRTWAKRNPTDFYRLAARLLPAEMAVSGTVNLQVVTGIPARKPLGKPDAD